MRESSFCTPMLTALTVVCSLSLATSFVPNNAPTSFGVSQSFSSTNIRPSASSLKVAAMENQLTNSDTSADTSRVTKQVEETSVKRQRGKFHPDIYNKPIVLLGCSGGNNELPRLAASLAKSLGGKSILASSSSDLTSIVSQIDNKELTRSDVITLDFSDAKNDLSTVAKSLYTDSGLLSIYVNVHPESSRMSEEYSILKSQLEPSLFLPHTAYELVVTSEGCATPYNIKMNPWEEIEWDLARLVSRATLRPAVPGNTDVLDENTAEITMGKHTYFLSLSFPQIESVKEYLPAMCADVDAMEFRTDLLDCREDRFDLLRSLQWLRRNCRPHAVRAPGLPSRSGMVMDDVLPVVYTVRTAHQAGTWPDDEAGIAKMFDLLELGLRSGVEVLDVESAWDPKKADELLSRAEDRYATQILGSHHRVPDEVSMEEAIGYFQLCGLGGRAHGTKVVLSIDVEDNDTMADDAGKIAQSLCRSEGKPVVPSISLILGEIGQYSRIINERFTPVTHESLPFVAAPGQLTAKQIMQDKVDCGHLEPRKFVILGHNIAYSVSPKMHNAAFKTTQLPHEYGRADYETVDEFVKSELWNDPAFGGCSVTIPHKQNIMPHVDRLSDSAEAIGAVNTVIVQQEKDFDGSDRRVLVGDNTDWRGIYNPLIRRLGSVSTDGDEGGKRGVSLILGAGGTARAAAYAATKLGLDLVYWNRTPDKLTGIVDAFDGIVVSDLSEENLGGALKNMDGEIKAVISTLPAAADFELPNWLIEQGKKSKPVIFDVNYKPYTTKLLAQAEKADLDVVRGSEMLWEQGVGQFQLWTGRTAPYKTMKSVVLDNCQ